MAELAPIRTRLGRYEIVRHLASGGMARVSLAKVSSLEGFERYVVLKQILPEHAGDGATVKMFLDEARIAASLHHANIVQVYDLGEDGGEYFMAMEYVHGVDVRGLLAQLCRAGRHLPFDHAVTIVASAAAGLHYAHEQRGSDRSPLGLVHRDISPSNLLVGYDGSVKVADFGIAKATHHLESMHTKVRGKTAYMSPEQCTGGRLDRRSDVFALGIVLHELCTTRRLFKSPSKFMTMSAIVRGAVPLPSRYRADVPGELEAIAMKALALAPADRFQTADEMRVALDRFATRAGYIASTTALADYVIAELGRRPEPWLAEPADATPSLDADFDGTASGLATVPAAVSAELVDVPPTSPLALARRAFETGAEPVSTISADAQPTPRPRRSRRWGAAAAVLLVAIGAGAAVAIVTRDTSPTSSASPTATPDPLPATSARAEPVRSPTAVESEPAPADPAQPAAVTPARKRTRKARTTVNEPAQQWDPDALFLDDSKR